MPFDGCVWTLVCYNLSTEVRGNQTQMDSCRVVHEYRRLAHMCVSQVIMCVSCTHRLATSSSEIQRRLRKCQVGRLFDVLMLAIW